MPSHAYLHVSGLTKRFGSGEEMTTAIERVSFTLARGRFMSILGPSGCGKSTLFNIIAGLLSPTEGDVFLEGQSILLRPGTTGYMLQKDLLLPWRTVADNITLSPVLQGQRQRDALQAAMEDVRACGLEALLNRRPDELSGGQRQRAALVRTLQTGKPLLLLDEPFGALDAITRLHLQELLTEIATRKGKTVLFVTHDVDEALLLSDEILVMGIHPGRILRHYQLPQPKPRDMRTLALPELMEMKADILDLLDEEVKQHDEQNA